jgi:hypothetical protein
LCGTAAWVLCGSGTPSAADWTLSSGWGNTPPTLSQIALLSPGAKPTAFLMCRDAGTFVFTFPGNFVK